MPWGLRLPYSALNQRKDAQEREENMRHNKPEGDVGCWFRSRMAPAA